MQLVGMEILMNSYQFTVSHRRKYKFERQNHQGN